MASVETYASVISIIYFSTYFFVFLIASIYCAYEVLKLQGSSTAKQETSQQQTKKSQLELVITNTNTQNKEIEAKDQEEIEQSSQTDKDKSCGKKLKSFAIQQILFKKSIYQLQLTKHRC